MRAQGSVLRLRKEWVENECYCNYLLFRGLRHCSRRWLVQRIQPWAFKIRHFARASSEESSGEIPLHSTLDHGSCGRLEWVFGKYNGLRSSLLIPNFRVRAVWNGILLAEIILHRSWKQMRKDDGNDG